jgi:hypothetical protein
LKQLSRKKGLRRKYAVFDLFQASFSICGLAHNRVTRDVVQLKNDEEKTPKNRLVHK